MRSFVDVPESDVVAIRTGAVAKVRPYAAPDRVFEGRVSRASGSLDSATRTMRVEIDLPNADAALLPGMYARFSLAIGERPNALVIPAVALFADGKQTVVNVIRDGKVARVAVKAGVEDQGRTEIIEGLADDASVIAAAAPTLTPGTPVVANASASH